MGPLGGQIEHVARVENPVVHRPEILEDLERGIVDQAAVVLVAQENQIAFG